MTKAFDTLDWSFIIKVFNKFGFCNTFCDWINIILHSAKLSISLNGSLRGYFSCKRSVRQGDPLSPLLFCIVEEVLSRGISKLVEQGQLELINGCIAMKVPSHSIYADEVVIFCKAKFSNIDSLLELF